MPTSSGNERDWTSSALSSWSAPWNSPCLPASVGRLTAQAAARIAIVAGVALGTLGIPRTAGTSIALVSAQSSEFGVRSSWFARRERLAERRCCQAASSAACTRSSTSTSSRCTRRRNHSRSRLRSSSHCLPGSGSGNSRQWPDGELALMGRCLDSDLTLGSSAPRVNRVQRARRRGLRASWRAPRSCPRSGGPAGSRSVVPA